MIRATTFLLHLALLAVLGRSTLEFMEVPGEARAWLIALVLATLPVLAMTRRRLAGRIFAGGVALAALWSVAGTLYWPESLDVLGGFVARWIVFLVEAYWGTLATVPPDLGYFSLWLLTVILAWWGWSQIERGATWPVLVPGFAYILFQWFFHFDEADYYLRLFMVPAFLLLALNHGRIWFSRSADRVIDGFPVLSSLWTVTALVLVVMLVATIVPLEGDPWTLSTVRRWFTDRFPTLERVRGGPDAGYNLSWFSISTSGFGSSSRLGGPVSLDTSTAFEVEIRAVGSSAEDLPFPLYFRGRTLTQYTGRGWESPDVEGWQWFELGQWLPRNYPTGVRSLRLIQDISPVDLRTHTVFGLGDVREVLLEDENHPYEDEEILGKNPMGDILINLASPLRQPYRVLSHLPYWEVGADEPPAPDEELSDPDRYLEIPAGTPDRVRELAEDITSEAETEYEAVLALVSYLRDIPYNLDVPLPPEDRDFADYFLFDGREGYCTYHATALAVMLRSVDIPARWIQGFIGSRDAFERESADSDILTYRGEITHATAHAWVEAWIPGYGWVPFEATPAYQPVDHTRTLPRDPVEVGNGPGRGDFDDELWPFEGDMEEEFFFEDLPEGTPTDPGPPLWQRILGVLGTTVVVLLVGGGVSLHYIAVGREREIGRRSVRRVLPDGDGAIEPGENAAARILRTTDLAIHYLVRTLDVPAAGLTDREFATAVAERSPQLGRIATNLVAKYEGVAYAGAHPSTDEAREAERLLGELLTTVRRERGGWNYLKMRYLPEIELEENGS